LLHGPADIQKNLKSSKKNPSNNLISAKKISPKTLNLGKKQPKKPEINKNVDGL
jgi:hypothetical protein